MAEELALLGAQSRLGRRRLAAEVLFKVVGGPRFYLGASGCSDVRTGASLPAGTSPNWAGRLSSAAPAPVCDASYARSEVSGEYGPCLWRHGACVNLVDTMRAL